MNFLFFLFPFFLFMGIAVQGLSYYLVGLVIPSLIFILNHKKIPTYFIMVGGAFIFLHIIFPIVNFIIYFLPNKEINPAIYTIALKWPGILQSNFPSSLFFGGLALILFTYISSRVQQKVFTNSEHIRNFYPLKFFLLGLVPASLLFMCLMLYGHYSGVDFHSIFRKKIEYLSADDAFRTGGFRVYGFYGHPLTVAGVCLAYSIFSWTLLWSYLTNKNKFNFSFLPFKNQNTLCCLFLIIVTFSNEMCLFLSGGRTATIVGIALLVLVPLCFSRGLNLRKNYLKIFIVIIFIVLASFFVSKKLGILNRIELTTTAVMNNSSLDTGNYRVYFWRTYMHMFLDKPIFGQGNYWLKQGVREEYYNKLGYEKLPEKYIAHNVYLEILGSIGAVGLVWIIVGLVYLFRVLKKNVFYEKSQLLPLSIALIFAFFGNLLHSITQNVFFDSSVVYIYICLIVVIMWESTNLTTKK